MSNGDEDKVSIQFQNMEKSTQRKQIHRSNLVLLDNQLIKKNRTLSIEKMISTIIL